MRLLLLGKNGQVGRALAPLLDTLGTVAAFDRQEANLEQPRAIGDLIDSTRPDVIVNAAAYTAVDAAEDDRARAFTVNAEAVGVIGEHARALGALVVHYSTDFVFDGKSARGYREDDTAAPLSVYGASKLAGDEALVASGADHLILRVTWNYSPDGKNFPLTILRLAKTKDAIDVVSDEVGAATSAKLIAGSTVVALEKALADRSRGGVYHLTAAGSASRNELARYVVAEAIAAGANLILKPEAIRPIEARNYPLKASRPSNSRLDTAKFRETFGVRLPHWQDGVRDLIWTLRNEDRL